MKKKKKKEKTNQKERDISDITLGIGRYFLSQLNLIDLL